MGILKENILTEEQMSSLRNFAQTVHSMNSIDLFKLNTNRGNDLTTEQKDIVSFEMKLRELEILKSKNIDPNVDFKVENIYDDSKREYDLTDPNFETHYQMGKALESELSEELLEKSKKIFENTPVPIKYNKNTPINLQAKKILYIDDNGEKIMTVDHNKFNEMYRKSYIKALSDITGIDYTVADSSFNENDDLVYLADGIYTEEEKNISYQSEKKGIDLTDYELDD